MLVQLQYIRAIAALLVVYFHGTLQIAKLDPDAVLPHYLFGKSGVDLFFVLSGFVMWITTSGKAMTVADFYWRRIRRIVPLYWAATLFSATVAFFLPDILKSTVFDLPHVLASLAFLPWINPADPAGAMIAPVIVPGWTLNFEMYFYALFGLCLLLPGRFRLAGLIGLIAALFVVCNLLPPTTATLFYGDSVVFEFVGGAVLGHIYLKGWRIPRGLVAPLVAFGFAALLYLDHLGLDLPRLVAIGIPAILIVCAATSVALGDPPRWRWLRALGDASYSIYLTHVFTLAGARMLHPHLPAIFQQELVFIALSLAASALVGLLSYHLFEVPVSRYLSGQLPVSRPPATGPLGAGS